jgi:thiol-disulfide isomerase/thioredoxin
MKRADLLAWGAIAILGMACAWLGWWLGERMLWPAERPPPPGVTVVKPGDALPAWVFESLDGGDPVVLSGPGRPRLINYWASWCGPCRKENPNVVAAYGKYNTAKFKDAKGFEVFSVSLDRSRDAWQKAIAQDGLKWKWHVSDLKFWQSQGAQLYGVNSIPMSFLIDPNGIIIAKNLRGMSLHTELDKYVKSL